MKKMKIIIISLVIVLVLSCTTFAVLYFATDTFKSDKELFYKYAGQMSLKEFIDLESYNNYLKRIETESHSNEGELIIDIDLGEETANESVQYSRIF